MQTFLAKIAKHDMSYSKLTEQPVELPHIIMLRMRVIEKGEVEVNLELVIL